MVQTECLVNSKAESIVALALSLLERQLKVTSYKFTKPSHEINYLKLSLATKEREQFDVLYLNNQNQLIANETVFMGTIDKVEIHPWEIARQALNYNAAALILAHNHPSGVLTPSDADKYITQEIINLVSLLDIRVFDHIVIVGKDDFSFAEHGLI